MRGGLVHPPPFTRHTHTHTHTHARLPDDDHPPLAVYFASSKAGHRVSALMGTVVGIDLPEDSPRLYASLLPPEEAKAGALRSIMERPVCQAPSTVLHFVDDRLDVRRGRGGGLSGAGGEERGQGGLGGRGVRGCGERAGTGS